MGIVKVKVYALMYECGIPGYYGRSFDPEARARSHWNDCDITKTWYQPKNIWLRNRIARSLGPPDMIIVATVEAEPSKCEDWPIILAAREAFPGMLTNLMPRLAADAPEWDLFDRLARAEDPDFDWMAFHEQIQEAHFERLRENNNHRTPERKAAQAETARQSWERKQTPEQRAKSKQRSERRAASRSRTPEERSAALAEWGRQGGLQGWTPERRAAMAEHIREVNQRQWTPERRAAMAEISRERMRKHNKN